MLGGGGRPLPCPDVRPPQQHIVAATAATAAVSVRPSILLHDGRSRRHATRGAALKQYWRIGGHGGGGGQSFVMVRGCSVAFCQGLVPTYLRSVPLLKIDKLLATR